MKKIILFISACSIMFSCTKETGFCCHPPHERLELVLLNAEGLNLLDPKVEGSLEYKDLELFYVVNGEKIRQYYGNLEHQKLLIIRGDGETQPYYLQVPVNNQGSDGQILTTIIEYSRYEPDTIQIKVLQNSERMIVSQYSINSKTVPKEQLGQYQLTKHPR